MGLSVDMFKNTMNGFVSDIYVLVPLWGRRAIFELAMKEKGLSSELSVNHIVKTGISAAGTLLDLEIFANK